MVLLGHAHPAAQRFYANILLLNKKPTGIACERKRIILSLVGFRHSLIFFFFFNTEYGYGKKETYSENNSVYVNKNHNLIIVIIIYAINVR